MYVSELAPTVSAAVVADVARASRANNLRDRITGVLVFDGLHFAQRVEGPQAAIEGLLQRLLKDVRHRHLEVLLHDIGVPVRQFPDWQLGYAFLDDDGRGIEALKGLRNTAAATAFDALMPLLDRGGIEQVAR